MRPLCLDVTGLRSHFGTTSVTFPEDWQLAAIVGPTGAGKSSLLEAIVYALFGSGTVPNASQPINLIADNTREMRVVLGFEVAGAKHEIVRTYRRSGASPPPVLKSPAETVSGVKPVDAAVFRLLRLSPEAFCQTALLPQGRFARLLEAGASEQRSTLNEFFRLGEVTEVAERLAKACDELAEVRGRVATVRRQLPDNPGAELAAAQLSLEGANAAASAAASLVGEVAQLLAKAEAAERRAVEQEDAASLLTSTARSLGVVADEAGNLAVLAAEIDKHELDAVKASEDAKAAVLTAKGRLAGLEPETVSRARAALEVLKTRADEAGQAVARAGELDKEASAAEEQFQLVEVELEKATSTYMDLEQTAQRAETTATTAAEHLRSGEALWEACQKAIEVRSDAESRASQAGADLEAAKEAVVAAATAQTEAEGAAITTSAGAVAADEQLATLTGEATKAIENAKRFAALADAFREAEQAAQLAEARLEEAQTEGAQARTAHGEAMSARERAKGTYQEIELSLAEARRAEAAASCAAHARPGEPCPVCKQRLPEDFAPPTVPPQLTEAEERLSQARSALHEAVEAAVRGQERLNAAERALVSAEKEARSARNVQSTARGAFEIAGGAEGLDQVQERAETAVKARQAAEQVAGKAREAAAAAEALWKARREAIGPLRELVARAERTAADAIAAFRKAEAAAVEATSAYADFGSDEGLQAARATSAEASATATQARDAARKAGGDVERLKTQREELGLTAGKARTAAIAAGEHVVRASEAERAGAEAIPQAARQGVGQDSKAILQVAEAWTLSRELEVEKAQAAIEDLQRLLEQSLARTSAVSERRAAEYSEPLSQLTTRAAALAVRAGATAPPTGDAGGLREWARRSATAAESVAADQERAARGAREEAAKVTGRASVKCQEAGTSVTELESWRASRDTAVGECRTRCEQAQAAAARCSELDLAMEATRGQARLLEDAKALSRGRGNFVNYVLATRRRQLVLEAAAVLGELSGQRLAFDTEATDRFSVVDTGTGAARDPRLLSGGEQFQASLALALALVEIAARGGSRIECLFLDEGFGALDARSLETAVDALETAARRGRRIVAVTHIQDVTSRCDQVLEVRPGVGGSKAAWRAAMSQ